MPTRLSTAEARARALDAARAIVLERGPRHFTIDAVAERSGVAKTTIYRGWPTVDRLLLDAAASVRSSIPLPETGSLRCDLVELLVEYVELGPRIRPLLIGLMAEAIENAEFDALRARFMANSEDPVRTVLAQGQQRGELAEDLDLEAATDLIEGPIFLRRIVHDDELSRASLERHVDACLLALPALSQRG